LGHVVVDIAKECGLDLQRCVGAGTDNCLVMTSETKGAVQEIKKEAPLLERNPCMNHALNSSLGKSCNVPACRNAMSAMKEVIQFAHNSAKKQGVFQKYLGESLTGLCETRFVERHDGVLQFRDNLRKIYQCLQEISSWSDAKTAFQASSLSKILSSSEFLVSMLCLSEVLGTTRPLSKKLQAPDLDLLRATNLLSDTLTLLKNSRRNADAEFKKIFTNAQAIANQLDTEITAPRSARAEQTPQTTSQSRYR